MSIWWMSCVWLFGMRNSMWDYVLWISDEVMSIKENQWNEIVKFGLHLCFEVFNYEEVWWL